MQATLLNGDEDSFWDLMVYFHEILPELKEKGLQGYYFVIGPPLMPHLYFGLKFMAFDQLEGAVDSATEPFRERLRQLEGTVSWEEQLERYEKFHQAYKGDIAEEPVGMGGMALGSRLLPADALADKAKLKKVLQAVGPSLGPEKVGFSVRVTER